MSSHSTGHQRPFLVPSTNALSFQNDAQTCIAPSQLVLSNMYQNAGDDTGSNGLQYMHSLSIDKLDREVHPMKEHQQYSGERRNSTSTQNIAHQLQQLLEVQGSHSHAQISQPQSLTDAYASQEMTEMLVSHQSRHSQPNMQISQQSFQPQWLNNSNGKSDMPQTNIYHSNLNPSAQNHQGHTNLQSTSNSAEPQLWRPTNIHPRMLTSSPPSITNPSWPSLPQPSPSEERSHSARQQSQHREPHQPQLPPNPQPRPYSVPQPQRQSQPQARPTSQPDPRSLNMNPSVTHAPNTTRHPNVFPAVTTFDPRYPPDAAKALAPPQRLFGIAWQHTQTAVQKELIRAHQHGQWVMQQQQQGSDNGISGMAVDGERLYGNLSQDGGGDILRMRDMEAEIERLRKELQKKETDVVDLKTERDWLKGRSKQLEKENKGLREGNVMAKKAIARMEEEVRVAREERKSMIEEWDVARQLNMRMLIEKAVLRDELVEARNANAHLVEMLMGPETMDDDLSSTSPTSLDPVFSFSQEAYSDQVETHPLASPLIQPHDVNMNLHQENDGKQIQDLEIELSLEDMYKLQHRPPRILLTSLNV